jgi:hypothetical protein
MPNPTKPATSATVISSSLFGRPTSAHVVRAYDTEANRDADNLAGDVEAGQLATIGGLHTGRYTSGWHRMPAGCDAAQVTAAGDGLIPANQWVGVGVGYWVLVPPPGQLLLSANMNGLEVPEIAGTPFLLLGVYVEQHSTELKWYEVARTSATAFWNKSGSMNGHRLVTGIMPGWVYIATGLYVTESCALRAGKASLSLAAFVV